MKPGKAFFYYDPIDALSPEAQARWKDETVYEAMIDEAVATAGLTR